MPKFYAGQSKKAAGERQALDRCRNPLPKLLRNLYFCHEPSVEFLCQPAMKIVEFNNEPIGEIAFLNAGRRPNQFYQDQVCVYHGRAEGLPDSLEAVVVTADLQGRELPGSQGYSPRDGLRLLGEVMPQSCWTSTLMLSGSVQMQTSLRYSPVISTPIQTYGVAVERAM